MEILGFLILFPLVIAGLLMVIRKTKPRNVIVCIGSAAIAIASIVLVVTNMGTTGTYFTFESEYVDYLLIAVDVIIAVTIIAFALKYRNVPALVLSLIQIIGTLVYEFMFAHGLECTRSLYIDSLSLIMALIIGILAICMTSILVFIIQKLKCQIVDQPFLL